MPNRHSLTAPRFHQSFTLPTRNGIRTVPCPPPPPFLPKPDRAGNGFPLLLRKFVPAVHRNLVSSAVSAKHIKPMVEPANGAGWVGTYQPLRRPVCGVARKIFRK